MKVQIKNNSIEVTHNGQTTTISKPEDMNTFLNYHLGRSIIRLADETIDKYFYRVSKGKMQLGNDNPDIEALEDLNFTVETKKGTRSLNVFKDTFVQADLDSLEALEYDIEHRLFSSDILNPVVIGLCIRKRIDSK